MAENRNMQPQLKDYLRLGWAAIKLLASEPSLLVRCLPRSWRGGYKSPWDKKNIDTPRA